MSKYYAVSVGREPGIYRSWADCQKQTVKFSGAIFKSFTTEKEAKEFLNLNQPSKDLSDDNLCVIYTDGSHQRSKNYLGIGAYCNYKDKEYRMSKECDTEMLERYGLEEYQNVCSNPTAEFLAFTEVLERLKGRELSPKLTIVFKIDYIGIGMWIRKEWQCNEPYIRIIRDRALELMKHIECVIRIEHIKGHSGIPGNEEADKCAGDHENYSNFRKLGRALEKD